MRKLVLIVGIIMTHYYPIISQEKIDIECLQGLWQRMSLRSNPKENFYNIIYKNNWIRIYTYDKKDSLEIRLNIYKFGYINEKNKDSIDVDKIKDKGKYYVETEYPKKSGGKAKILFIDEKYSISCDEDGYEESNDMDENFRRQYLPLKIWNQLITYCRKTKINYIKEFELEKFNPAISVAQGAILFKDAELKTKIKTLSKNYQVQVLEQKWNVLKISCKDFEGWVDEDSVIKSK